VDLVIIAVAAASPAVAIEAIGLSMRRLASCGRSNPISAMAWLIDGLRRRRRRRGVAGPSIGNIINIIYQRLASAYLLWRKSGQSVSYCIWRNGIVAVVTSSIDESQ